MTDKIIINTISKIHFIIVSFLIFIFLTLSVIFVILQNGLHINRISVQNLQIEQLYIKWDEKINVTVEKIHFTPQSKDQTSFDYKKIKQIFRELFIFNNWFEKIIVNQIEINDLSASLKYTDKDNGFFVASSPSFLLHGLLSFKSNAMTLHVEEFHDFKRKIDINGDLIFDLKELALISLFNININQNDKLRVISYADENKLFYRINAPENMTDIKYIINLFPLPTEVKYWVLDAISMSDLSLNKIDGWLEYSKLDEAYKHVYVSAEANNLLYTYNPKLQGVQSKTTELEFKDGVLNILPKEAYSYGFFLDKSWLKIDFNKKEELLTLYLKFKGSVDKNILKILSTYKINLPFTQNTGTVNTDLKIEVNLHSIAVEAVGDFFTKEANFNYLGLDIDIYDAYISLNNYDVKIKNMLAKYQDIARAKVNVKLNVKKHEGKIEFKVENTEFKKLDISLKKQIKPLLITYKVLPERDIININDSVWNIKDKEVYVSSLDMPFDLKELSAEIPTTLVEIPNVSTAYMSGKVSFKLNTVNLKIDLLKFLYDSIKLSQSNSQIELDYQDKNIKMKSLDKIRFSIDGTEATVEDLDLSLQNDIFYIKQGLLNIDNFINTKFSTYYNLKSKNGIISLNNLNLKNENMNEIFSNKETVNLVIKSTDENTTFTSSELSTEYTLANNEWKFKINSLSEIAKKSQLLQDYNLTEGSVEVHKQANDKNIHFLANVKYPYKILVADNVEVENYIIKGKINSENKKIYLNINDTININADENIRVKAKDTGFNINSILNFINDRNSTSNKSDKKVTFSSENCYLYIDKNRRIVSDSIDLQYLNNAVTAQLIHHEANAGFKLENNKFHLYGDKFDDKFMENLFALSRFKDGALAFTISGSTKEYDGTFIIKDTAVLDYKILNNVLAFVNTIPSLVTFSLPGYSSKGLPVKEAYMKFKAKDDIYNITDMSLNSPELKILGRGVANFKADTINLDLNLQTDLGSGMSKIPAVGYILFGENSISTSLSVTGSLTNPDVNSKLAQEIIVAPLNIIKRTLLFPYKLLKGK